MNKEKIVIVFKKIAGAYIESMAMSPIIPGYVSPLAIEKLTKQSPQSGRNRTIN